MKVSYNWLKDYLDLDISAEELAERLTNSGVEVEGLIPMNPGIDHVVIGEVVDAKPHPDGDKLTLTNVKTGSGEALCQIVCGAPNVASGQKVPVALVGTELPGGLEIKKTTIRGEASEGMICSCKELGLLEPELEDGIMVLDQDAPVGESIVSYLDLNDTVLEFDLTPNRADCLGMIGVAIEVAALLDIPLKDPKLKDFGDNQSVEGINIAIQDSELCERYSGKIIKNVRIGTSPMWLQQRLRAYGIRPINNLVDITNYVMLEYGQPLHAFDYDLIRGHEIIVRKAHNGEEIVTLDEKTRTLTSEDLIIADRDRGIAVAGVMGGYNTEVTDKTESILLESAAFHNISVRRTATRLNLRSEASLRFEKGVDPNGTVKAIQRACELFESLGVGTVVPGVADEYPTPRERQRIKLRTEKVKNLTGLDVTTHEVEDIFRRLQFKVEDNPRDSHDLIVAVPTRRNDITAEVDLIEEVARLYGYSEIPTTMPEGPVTQGRKTHDQQVIGMTRETLLSSGLSEVISYAFISPDDFDRIGLPEDDALRRVVPLANPMTREHSVMRTTMIPSILKVLEYNSNYGEKDFQIFEIGRVYLPQGLPVTDLPEERVTLTFGGVGRLSPKEWLLESVQEINFYYLKGIFELLMERLNIEMERVQFTPVQHPSFHPTRAASIFLDAKRIGIMGEIHPEILGEFGLDSRTALAELDLQRIIQNASLVEKYQPLPKYPAVLRDMALLVPKEIPSEEVTKTISQVGGALIEELRLFDLYQGDRIPEDKKSLAYSLKFRDPETTLTDKQVDEVYEKIEYQLKDKLGAEIRKA